MIKHDGTFIVTICMLSGTFKEIEISAQEESTIANPETVNFLRVTDIEGELYIIPYSRIDYMIIKKK